MKILKNEKIIKWLLFTTCVVCVFRALQLEDIAMAVLLVIGAILSLLFKK